jgi:putative membrane protein
MKNLKHYCLLFLKGVSMGTADVIPGISSGTIALITGIYRQLLGAIHSFNKTAFKLLLTGKWRQFWTHIHGSFLLPVGLGITVSLLTTVHVVRYLLSHHPIEIWSFFFGLSIISSIAVYQQIKKFNFLSLCITLIGGLLGYLIIQISPLATTSATWFIFMSGSLAMCAMILPGISGSLVLLILGKYTFMLDALESFDWPILTIFMLGGAVGLITFSSALLYMLRQYTDHTIALLAGFMIGSIPKTWPWKNFASIARNVPSSILLEENISPMQFQAIHHKDPRILQALLCISLGCLIVILLKKLGNRKYI